MQPLSSTESAALLARSAHGDREAFKRLYEGTVRRIAGVIARLVRDEHLAEDVLAETYLQVWQQAKSYGPHRGSVVGWIAMMSRSRAVDALRRKARQDNMANRLHRLSHSESPHGTAVGAQEALVRSETLQALQARLNDLPCVQGQAIQATFLDGATHQEAAKKLGQPLGTLKTRVRLGLAAMERSMSTAARLNSP